MNEKKVAARAIQINRNTKGLNIKRFPSLTHSCLSVQLKLFIK